MPNRRLVLAAAALWPLAAWPQQRAALIDPLRLGADRGLAAAGLVRALVLAFGRDTGIAVKTSTAPASQLLESLERGELDVALVDAPDAERRLVDAGLAHERRPVASAEFVVVGPAPQKKPRTPDPAGIAGERDVAAALRRIRDAAAPFVSAGDGSGVHLLEQSLWRAAQIAPEPPWYAALADGAALASEARARVAYAVVERGVWSAQGGAPLAVLVEGDPRLLVPVHAMRSFRSSHRAARLFTDWIGGPKGRRAVAGVRGFR
jgi:tungstate transport system substrate-binding protein